MSARTACLGGNFALLDSLAAQRLAAGMSPDIATLFAAGQLGTQTNANVAKVETTAAGLSYPAVAENGQRSRIETLLGLAPSSLANVANVETTAAGLSYPAVAGNGQRSRIETLLGLAPSSLA